MDRPPSANAVAQPARLWLGLAALALVMSALEATQLYARAGLEGWPIELSTVISRAIASWTTFAVLTPLALWWARRHPPVPMTPAAITAHLAGGLSFALLHQVATGSLLVLLVGHPLPKTLGFIAVAYSAIDLLLYLVVVVAGHLLESSRRLAAKELRTAILEADLHASSLEALKVQLHPHFLFNALQAISGLALKGHGHEAAEATAALGDLLRDSLEADAAALIRLDAEIELADRYLAIWRLRHPGRFELAADLAPGTAGLRVPRLVLQPLIENAVIHGIVPTGGPGTIRVRATSGRDRLAIEVLDDGAGAEPAAEGTGLANVRARLRRLAGETATVATGRNPSGGWRVVIDMPILTPAPT